MNENAERINGLAAMLGIIAAMGAYATTGTADPRHLVIVSNLKHISIITQCFSIIKLVVV